MHSEVGAVINPDGESEAPRWARVCPRHAEAAGPALKRTSLFGEQEERCPYHPPNLISPSSRMVRPSGLVPSIALGRALVCPHSSQLLLSPRPWLYTPPSRGWWAGLSTIQVLPALSPGPTTTDPLHTSSNSLNLSGPQFPQLQNGVTRGLS